MAKPGLEPHLSDKFLHHNRVALTLDHGASLPGYNEWEMLYRERKEMIDDSKNVQTTPHPLPLQAQ